MSAFSFKDMKRNSSANLEKLTSELNKINQQGFGKDERIWQCQQDKAGNGYAVIRFLPAPAGEDMPFVRLWSHGFKGPGGWYIENSLTTIGQTDPVAEMNTALWNQGEGSPGRKRVTGTGRDNPGTKRQLSYYSNIYVVKDPANPENEGKVFLFKYGKKIFDKLNEAMNPQFPDEKPINPFDFWDGANFKLKIRRVEGYANFDSSEFESTAPLLDDDAKMEEIWKSQYSLAELVAADKFKSYDELKKKLDRVLGQGQTGGQSAQAASADQDVTPPWNTDTASKFKEADAPAIPESNIFSDDDDDDDTFAMFKSIAEED